MKRFHTLALLLALAFGIVSEWLCLPILDAENQSNLFLGLKSLDYPSAICFWFHSWTELLLGSASFGRSNYFPDLSYSPIFHLVAVLQWALSFYLLLLFLRFFYRLTNARILKTAIAIVVVLLLVTLHYKLYSDFSEYPRLRNDALMLADSVGYLKAEKDFGSGMLRKFVFGGTNSTEQYLGTNSGPFQLWSPNFVDAPYEVSRFVFGNEIDSYNKTMQKKYRDSSKHTNAAVSSAP